MIVRTLQIRRARAPMAMFGSRDDALLAAIDRTMARVEFDLDGTVTDANAVFLDLVATRSTKSGPASQNVRAEADRSGPNYSAFWDRLRAVSTRRVPFPRVTKAGHTVWIQGSYNPILDPPRQAHQGGQARHRHHRGTRPQRAPRRSGRSAQPFAGGDLLRPRRTITDANSNFLSTMGYTLEEIRGRHHRMFMAPAEAASRTTRRSGPRSATASTRRASSGGSGRTAAPSGSSAPTTRSSTPTASPARW